MGGCFSLPGRGRARQVFAEEAALLRVCARAAGSRGLHWAASDRDPGVGRRVPLCAGGHYGEPLGQAAWSGGGRESRKRLARHGGGYDLASWAILGRWSGAVIPEVPNAPPHPSIYPFNSCCFQQGFSLSSPHTSQGRGPEWGTGHRMLVSKGDCPWTDTQSGRSPACLRLCSGQPSPPMDTG